MLGTPAGTFHGIKIYTSPSLVEPWDDWSGVRSPSRAKRRLNRGFRQNIVRRFKPQKDVFYDKSRNALYCHPAVLDELKEVIRRQNDKSII